MVEVKGAKTLLRACVTQVTPGMEIFTNTERVRKARTLNLELLLASHPKDCFVCDRNQTCELRRISFDMGIREVRFPKTTKLEMEIDSSSPSLIRDPNKCILCRRCIAVCTKVQSVSAIDSMNRGKLTKISTFMDQGLGKVDCINCGQCLLVCPTGALTENSHIQGVWKALADPKKFVVVETAPAVRASIGEEFGMAAGSLATGKMAAALRRLGFNKVFDTQFSADLTIMEEGHELISRIKNKGRVAPDHVLFSGLDKIRRAFLSEDLRAYIQLQVAAADVRRSREDLLCKETRDWIPGISSWFLSCPAPQRNSRRRGLRWTARSNIGKIRWG